MSNARPADPFNLCSFKFANGHLCGLPAHSKGEGLCLVHYRRLVAAEKPREVDLSRELASPGGDFMTQIDIHQSRSRQTFPGTRLQPHHRAPRHFPGYIAYLISQSQKAASNEARNWDENKDVYQRWIDLKDPILTKQNAALYEELLQYKAARAQPKAAAATASALNSISAPTTATKSSASDSFSQSLVNIPTESLTVFPSNFFVSVYPECFL